MKAINDFFEQIDLSKKFPNYFNKKLIKTSMYLCFAIIIISLIINKGSFFYFYAECNNDTCMNPLFVQVDNRFEKSNLCYKKGFESFCLDPIMQKGDKIGNYNYFVQNSNNITLMILIITFIINHILYKRKNGKRNNN
jgi:hypothetical protein